MFFYRSYEAICCLIASGDHGIDKTDRLGKHRQMPRLARAEQGAEDSPQVERHGRRDVPLANLFQPSQTRAARSACVAEMRETSFDPFAAKTL